MLIYKIFRGPEWADLQAAGATAGAPIDVADGYVHFSTAAQARETAAKHFAGEDGLHLLAVEAEGLGRDLRWEPSRGEALFPHLYRALRMDDVAWHVPLPLQDGVHIFPAGMLPDEAFIDPARPQFEIFKSLPRDHPIEMLNLVRFRAEAAYPEGHELAGKGLSGAEAYANYGRDSAPVFQRVGGAILWRGQFQTTLIGPDDEAWDAVFIARYPDASAFLAMVTDPEYQVAVVHRQAAVLTSRLIRCAKADGGAEFG